MAVFAGPILNAALGWWWADPAAFVIFYYGLHEGRNALQTVAGR